MPFPRSASALPQESPNFHTPTPRVGELSRLAASIALIALFTSGCIYNPAIEIPTSEEFTQVLSQLATWPEMTCEELRTSLHVEYLPLAETPADIGLNYEEHWARTVDNEQIQIWYLPTDLDRGTVILSQGAAGTKACYLFIGRLFQNSGWSVVMYDYRGFGESSGQVDIGKLHLDLDAVIDWASSYLERDVYTLWAVSLGSVPTVEAAVSRPEQINGVILDSPVALGLEIERFRFFYGAMTQTLIDLLPPELLPEELVRYLQEPLLVIENGADTVTPARLVRVFYERTSGARLLVSFSSLGHAAAPYHGTSEYSYYIERFMSSIWEQYEPIEVMVEGAR